MDPISLFSAVFAFPTAANFVGNLAGYLVGSMFKIIYSPTVGKTKNFAKGMFVCFKYASYVSTTVGFPVFLLTTAWTQEKILYYLSITFLASTIFNAGATLYG